MENILRLYALEYDSDYPLISFDERPCFLIGDKVEGIAVKSSAIKKEDYEYVKNGSCTLFAAIEPLTGKRFAKVYNYRRKIEYANFMKSLAEQFPKAKKIRLIQDNLNTHNTTSFYQNFDAQTAFELTQRFEFHYTPKKGSWLNVIEAEFSALARLCLKITTKEQLEEQVLALIKERSDKQLIVNWKFSLTDARKKLNRNYIKIDGANERYTNT